MLLSIQEDNINAENFVYWLRGYLEIAQPKKIRKPQIDIINQHLDLVLMPVTKLVSFQHKGLKPALLPLSATPSEKEDKQLELEARDRALTDVKHWYPNRNEDVFPRLHWPDGPYPSC